MPAIHFDAEFYVLVGFTLFLGVLLWTGAHSKFAALIDSRMRFLGTPAGYEFVSLVQAVLLAGGRGTQLSDASRQRLETIDKPMTLQVFTTPT